MNTSEIDFWSMLILRIVSASKKIKCIKIIILNIISLLSYYNNNINCTVHTINSYLTRSSITIRGGSGRLPSCVFLKNFLLSKTKLQKRNHRNCLKIITSPPPNHVSGASDSYTPILIFSTYYNYYHPT